MKRLLLVSSLLVLLAGTRAHAQDWSIAGRLGGAVLTQDIDSDTEGDAGFLLNGRALYHLHPAIRLGVDVDWSNHDVDFDGSKIGDTNIVTLLPVVEFHPLAYMGIIEPGALWSPYGVFGLGINFNSFNEKNGLDIDPEHTFAVKVGAGLDVRIISSLYVNGELGYKFNIGDAQLKGPGFSVDRDFRASTFQFLLGLRYLF